MKRFVDYLIESSKTYEFRVKVAGEITDEHMGRIENQMERFGLESISKPKRTPIQKQPAGFAASVTNTEVNVMELVTNYPATPQQINAIVQEIVGLPESHVVTTNKNSYEEIEHEAAANAKEQEYDPLLGSDYKEEKFEPTFGDEYNAKLLKQLETRKYKFATDKKQ